MVLVPVYGSGRPELLAMMRDSISRGGLLKRDPIRPMDSSTCRSMQTPTKMKKRTAAGSVRGRVPEARPLISFRDRAVPQALSAPPFATPWGIGTVPGFVGGWRGPLGLRVGVVPLLSPY